MFVHDVPDGQTLGLPSQEISHEHMEPLPQPARPQYVTGLSPLGHFPLVQLLPSRSRFTLDDPAAPALPVPPVPALPPEPVVPAEPPLDVAPLDPPVSLPPVAEPAAPPVPEPAPPLLPPLPELPQATQHAAHATEASNHPQQRIQAIFRLLTRNAFAVARLMPARLTRNRPRYGRARWHRCATRDMRSFCRP